MIEARPIEAAERVKYSAIWEFPEYREYSPGLANVDRFLALVRPKAGERLIDLGCGTGGAGLELARRGGLNVSWLDLTDAALDPAVDRSRFIQAALWDQRWLRTRVGWDYGFCCDVFEHLPIELTMLSAANIVSGCEWAWLQICFRPDAFGALIGEPLHLTVQPFTWWRDRLASVAKLEEARDLGANGIFVIAGRA